MSCNINGRVTASTRIRLEYLDGLRGIAAFYVLLSHVYAEVVWSYDSTAISPLVLRLVSILNWGHYSVVVFIVLSGYCLMIPVARSQNNEMGSFSSYIQRRSRRILPPYYAALLLSLLTIALVPGLRQMNNVRWDDTLPAFTPGVVISHLLLIHNFRPDWIYRVNTPMWSVATEWQIYFLFPLILLPVWRRFGIVLTVSLGFILGMAAYKLSHGRLGYACPWFLGVFATGMAGAIVNFTNRLRIKHEIPWNILGFGLVLVTAVCHAFLPSISQYGFLMDGIAGSATVCLLIHCTRWLQDHPRVLDQKETPPALLRVLESRVAIGLGKFSYSLYLTHIFTLGGLHLILRLHSVSPTNCIFILLALGVPLSLGVSYVFFLVFEKPFVTDHSKTQTTSTQATTSTTSASQ